MFDELEKYKKKNHFFLTAKDNLNEVCNAPDKPGVYIVYALAKGKIDLVYIGSTKSQPVETKENAQGKKKISTVIVNNLSDQILGNAFSQNKSRRVAWTTKIAREKLDGLDIYWYVTMDKNNNDLPEDVERVLMQTFIHLYGTLPKWNVLQ
jgi:hypothetical protein